MLLNLVYDCEHPHADPAVRVSEMDVLKYIDAFDVEHPPSHPTNAIAWDLNRTFGWRTGRRLLLRAAQKWDRNPMPARKIVDLFCHGWHEDHQPQPWVDVYLSEVIGDWRDEQERKQRQHEKAQRSLPVAIIPFPSQPAPQAPPPPPKLIYSSAEFVAGFEPPEFLIDGTIQRRYFYSMTAQTGVGKTSVAMRWMAHVVTGRPIGDAEVQQGSVLYFAGENPSDVLYRWLVLSREMGIDPATDRVNWIVGAKNLNSVAEQITAEVAAKNLNLAYVVIDTAAAYNPGDEENSNNQAGDYARQLRSLTTLPGGPCVVVLCHPTKAASDEALVPRGGGAFLAEVDGNMAVMRKDSILAVTPLGKFRGDMSWVQRYEIDVIKDHPKLKDARGRQMKSVLARPVAEGVAAVMEKRSDADTASVLRAVCDKPGLTPTDYARALGWTYGPKNEANNVKVSRVLKRLLKEKLVVERLGTWRTTPAGDKELNALDLARAATPVPPFPLPR